MSDVAEVLGITRRTMYRYFADTDELFVAVAEVALGGFVAQVEAVTADLDVTGQLMEVVAYIIEQLPHEPQFTLLLAHDQSHLFQPQDAAPGPDRTVSGCSCNTPTSTGRQLATTTKPSTSWSSSCCA